MTMPKGRCLLSLLLLAGVAIVFGQNEEGDMCLTPDSAEGNCVRIEGCAGFYRELMEANTDASRRRVQMKLREHGCGFVRRDPLICCPVSAQGAAVTSVTQPPRPTPMPIPATPPPPRAGSGGVGATYSEPPPDVSAHPNARLVNSAECGEAGDNRILGGNATALFEFPWMALVQYRKADGRLEFQCGASIINERYVLTAAHCVTQLPRGDELVAVRVGEHDLSTDPDCDGPADGRYCAEAPQNVPIERAVPHPAYSRQLLSNDIALIRLAEPIRFHANALPVCLPLQSAERNLVMENRNFTVTGWGATEDFLPSQLLLKVSLPVITNEQCGRVHNRSVSMAAGGATRQSVSIGFRQVCAGGTNSRADSCGGDSGGPLQILTNRRVYQYGIVSFGPRRCGTPGIPAVYTRVAHYMDWILDMITE